MTDDFFRSRLDGMIDPRHPLAVLGDKLPWHKLEASIAPIFAHQAKPVETDTGFDFGGGGVCQVQRWGCQQQRSSPFVVSFDDCADHAQEQFQLQ